MSKIALALKYRPKTFDDVVEQDAIKQTLKHQLDTMTIKNCYLFTGPAGCGKAQPLYSKVLTPNGFIEMKDVEIGTEVIGCDGEIHKVSATYDRGVRDIYEITFNDRTTVRCCDEHLWTVRTGDSKKYITIELKNIINKPLYKEVKYSKDNSTSRKWLYSLPLSKPANFTEKSVFIPPYVMGLLIADGSLTNQSTCSISLYEEDIRNKVELLINSIGYTLHLASNNYENVHDYRIVQLDYKAGNQYKTTNEVFKSICDLKLNVKSNKKHIPTNYLFNSVNNRIDLLRGLLDGDGYITTNGSSVYYTTTSYQLAMDISFLIRSLGGYAVLTGPHKSKYSHNGKEHQTLDHYDLYIKMPNDIIPVSSQKHLSRYKCGHTTPKKTIRNIKYIGKEPCKCIMVDSEEHYILLTVIL